MNTLRWVKTYSKKHGLEFKQLSGTHFRVSKGKQFVDFWSNGSGRRIDGTYWRVGAWARGWGLDRLTNDSYYGDIDEALSYIKYQVKLLAGKATKKLKEKFSEEE